MNQRLVNYRTGSALKVGLASVLALGTAAFSTTALAASPHANANSNAQASSPGNSNHTSPGDNNAGDVWLQDENSFPGHQNEPHLGCGTIYIYGNGLADASGTLTIDSWPPSGSQQPVNGYTNQAWTYNTTQEGNQVIYQFQGSALVSAAIAGGASSSNPNGYHFKLDLTQDPQKHKTFWIKCAPTTPTPTPVPTPTPTPTPVPTPTPSPIGGGTGGTGSTPTPTPVATPTPVTTPSPQGGSVGGTSTGNDNQSGVLGASTNNHSGVQGASTSNGGHPSGVLAASTGTPGTGAALPIGAAVALILLGTILLVAYRRKATLVP